MSEKGKIVRSIHIANGTELTEDGVLFFEQLKMEALGNVSVNPPLETLRAKSIFEWEGGGEFKANELPPMPFDPISVMLRWGCQPSECSAKRLEIDPRY